MSGEAPCNKTIRRRAQAAVENRERFLALRQQLLQHNVVESSDSNDNSGDSGTDDVSSHESVQSAALGSEEELSGISDHDSNASDVAERMEAINDEPDEPREEGDVASGVSSSEEEIEDNVLNLAAEEKEDYVIESIRQWAIRPGVLSMRKLDDLLCGLSVAFPKMPKSYKTLLSTEKHSDIVDMGRHLMWYYGIKKSLDQFHLEAYLRVKGSVAIDINMDGLPLYKSGTNPRKSKFWPILGKLVGTTNKPFIIAIHFGSDPDDVDLFLGQFIVEVDELQTNGYYLNGVSWRFSIRNYILDAPARSLVKCCIGHGGYGACEKCTVVGAHEMNRIQFANRGVDCVLRTDESYRNQADRLHHTGRSPLELIGTGMVTQFRLDSMHLVYEGVFKRLLEVWMTWNGEWKLDQAKVNEISEVLRILKETCTVDFNRKPRNLEEWTKYKAKDYRRLLLYEGVVAFQKLDKPLYEQYLLLQCAMYILANPYLLEQFADNAQLFVDTFIEHAKAVFGNHFVVYNVHSLGHIVDECKNNGVLDSFSAFVYENELKSIKQTLKSGFQPLQQIAKRRSERRDKIDVVLDNADNVVKLRHPHIEPDEEEAGDQYKEVQINNVIFKANMKDSCFMTNDGNVYVVRNILSRGRNSVFFSANQFLNVNDCYIYPMNSSQLGILKVWNLSDNRDLIPIEAVFAKCWLMRNDDHYVSIFAVVKFCEPSEDPGEEDAVSYEVVSCQWLKLDEDTSTYHCWWPEEVRDTDVPKLVRKHAIPLENGSWKLIPCEVTSTYDTYLQAHIGAKNRVNDSSYETEQDFGKGKRKKRRREVSSSEEDIPSAKKTVSPPRIEPPQGNARLSQFKAPKGKKSPVKVSTSSAPVNALQNENVLKIVRKNRGSATGSVSELREKLLAKKNEVTAASVNRKLIATSPNWKASQIPSSHSKRRSEVLSLNGLEEVEEDEETHHDNESLVSEVNLNESDEDMTLLSDDLRKDICVESNRVLHGKPRVSKSTHAQVEEETPGCDKAEAGGSEKSLSLAQIKENLKKFKPASAAHGRPSSTPDRVKKTLSFSSPKKRVTPRKSLSTHHKNSSGLVSPSSIAPSSPPALSPGINSPRQLHLQQRPSYYSDFERETLKLLREINGKTENVSSGVNRLSLHLLPNEKVMTRPKGLPTLPLNALEDLNRMEKYLLDTDNMSFTSIYLSSFVSKDPTRERSSAMKLMANICSNFVGCHFNLYGQRNNKEAFVGLHLYKAIQGAVTLKLEETDFTETNKGIQSWLKDAPKRFENNEASRKQSKPQKSGSKGSRSDKCRNSSTASERSSKTNPKN